MKFVPWQLTPEICEGTAFVSAHAFQEMANSIRNFPDNAKGIVSNLSFMQSFFPNVGYVFFQLFHDEPGDYDTEYRPRRRCLLELACGAAKSGGLISRKSSASLLTRQNTRCGTPKTSSSWIARTGANKTKLLRSSECRVPFLSDEHHEGATLSGHRFPIAGKAVKSSEDRPQSTLPVRIGQEIQAVPWQADNLDHRHPGFGF